MSNRFLRLGKTLVVGRSLIWGNPLAAGVVFTIVISLFVLMSLLLRDVNQVVLPTAVSNSTTVAALQAESPTSTPLVSSLSSRQPDPCRYRVGNPSGCCHRFPSGRGHIYFYGNGDVKPRANAYAYHFPRHPQRRQRRQRPNRMYRSVSSRQILKLARLTM